MGSAIKKGSWDVHFIAGEIRLPESQAQPMNASSKLVTPE
jgi:hypothetical protein